MLTLDGYIRVSRVAGRSGETFISPDDQRDQIEGWAKLRNVTIAAWHTDLDVSGGTMRRPGLDTLMDRVRSGATGGVAVAYLDRLSRASVVDALNTVTELHEAGGQLAAIDLGIDPTTPFGEFAMTMMLALGRMQRRRITEQWRTSRRRAVARGVHVASARPTGYRRQDDGRLEPHPDEADAIGELFRRAAAGDSWTDLAQYLTDQRVTGPYGPLQWVGGAIPHIIKNRVYLGEARSGEFVNPDAHEPLIPRAVWEAAQIPKGAPAVRGIPSLMAGLLRCAGCRHLMKADSVRVSAGRSRTYRCRGFHSSGTCPDRAAAMGHLVEAHVEKLLLERLGSRAFHGADDDQELAAAEAVAGEEEDALRAYRDDERVLAALGQDRYVEGLVIKVARADEAHAHAAELRAKRTGAPFDLAETAQLWPDMETLERRRVLAATIDCVFMRSGRSLPIEDRIHIFWRGEGPTDLPRKGRRVPFGPLDWPDSCPPAIGMATS